LWFAIGWLRIDKLCAVAVNQFHLFITGNPLVEQCAKSFVLSTKALTANFGVSKGNAEIIARILVVRGKPGLRYIA
jgi:hypothetical protein